MTATNTDRIEKKILLRAPKARVWRALTDAHEFGSWFKVNLKGSFAVGERIRGNITHPGYEHLTAEMNVERMDAEELFAFRWHPYAVDPNVDYSKEPMTLVELKLEDGEGGTRITVVESGFDRLPEARRSEAFLRNAEGWTAQLENVKQHVGG